MMKKESRRNVDEFTQGERAVIVTRSVITSLLRGVRVESVNFSDAFR